MLLGTVQQVDVDPDDRLEFIVSLDCDIENNTNLYAWRELSDKCDAVFPLWSINQIRSAAKRLVVCAAYEVQQSMMYTFSKQLIYLQIY